MKKKFEIQLSCKIVCNWKIKLEANSEEEAKALAVEEYRHNPQKGEIIELDGIDEDFDLDEETGIYCEEVEDSTEEDQQKIQSLHDSQGKFGTPKIAVNEEDFEIIDLDIDVDSVINQAVSELTAEEIHEQIKRGEDPDVILASEKIYQQASALKESGKAWFNLKK
jgi:hypothetical protein